MESISPKSSSLHGKLLLADLVDENDEFAMVVNAPKQISYEVQIQKGLID